MNRLFNNKCYNVVYCIQKGAIMKSKPPMHSQCYWPQKILGLTFSTITDLQKALFEISEVIHRNFVLFRRLIIFYKVHIFSKQLSHQML